MLLRRSLFFMSHDSGTLRLLRYLHDRRLRLRAEALSPERFWAASAPRPREGPGLPARHGAVNASRCTCTAETGMS